MNLELVIEAIRHDKNLNKLNNLNFPCSVCNKNVLNNQKAIQCDSCNLWFHIKSDGTSIETYNNFILSEDSETWHCLLCKVKYNHIIFPFTLCDDIEIQNINNSNTARFCDFLPKFAIANEISKFSNQYDKEVDYNLPVCTSRKYYTVNEFQNLKNSKNLNIFHTNINGLESKFDNLQEFVSSTSFGLDIISITETSHKNSEFFTTNVSLKGYNEFYTPSNSVRGGTAIYVKVNYDTFERSDLKIQNDCFESTWIEIKNNHNKNILCGCIYRHPKYNLLDFINYLETTRKKIANENKEVYICV